MGRDVGRLEASFRLGQTADVFPAHFQIQYLSDLRFIFSHLQSTGDPIRYTPIMSITDATAVEIATAASSSARSIAILSTEARNNALDAIHTALSNAKEQILAANARDLESASIAANDGSLSQAVLKRLDLGRKGKWEDMLKGILDVRDLDDPGKLISPVLFHRSLILWPVVPRRHYLRRLWLLR